MFEQIDFLFNKESACISFSDNDFSCKGVAYIKRNAEAKSLMLNSYVDILDRDTFKFFVGGGMGIANIKETIKRSASGKAQSITHEETDFTYSENSISKAKNNFAYALMFGTNMKLNPRINLELMYTWKDFGKVKHKSIDSNQYAIKNKYKGHNFSTGLRFDL
jgi:opacity protein-like surface antigen